MDYVFGEWKFSDAARFRVGNVKQPFGLYTEVFDVGTLRPFASLSQSIYGPGGMIGKSYSGMGLTGVLLSERALSVEYDIYGGGLETLEEDTPIQVLQQGADTVGRALLMSPTRTWRDVVGGRFVIRTPIDGFSFGGSAYSGTRPLVRTGTNKDCAARSPARTRSWSTTRGGCAASSRASRTRVPTAPRARTGRSRTA